MWFCAPCAPWEPTMSLPTMIRAVAPNAATHRITGPMFWDLRVSMHRYNSTPAFPSAAFEEDEDEDATLSAVSVSISLNQNLLALHGHWTFEHPPSLSLSPSLSLFHLFSHLHIIISTHNLFYIKRARVYVIYFTCTLDIWIIPCLMSPLLYILYIPSIQIYK